MELVHNGYCSDALLGSILSQPNNAYSRLSHWREFILITRKAYKGPDKLLAVKPVQNPESEAKANRIYEVSGGYLPWDTAEDDAETDAYRRVHPHVNDQEVQRQGEEAINALQNMALQQDAEGEAIDGFRFLLGDLEDDDHPIYLVADNIEDPPRYLDYENLIRAAEAVVGRIRYVHPDF